MVGKKKSNKRILIIMLIVLLLALAIGYAAFSDILSISGVANAKGTFDLEFQNAEVVKAVGVNEEETTAVISADKNILTVKTVDLSYPGAGVEYAVDIVNVGTIPARVNEIKVSNLAGTEHIEIKGLEVIDTEHPTINPKDKCNIHFTVEWPKEKNTEITEKEETMFELQIEYTQATAKSFDGQPSHEDIVGNTVGGGEVTPPEEPKVNLAETITGADYGKSINYKATVQGQEVSNWKIFLNDGKNVYIILDDYLPNTLVPTSTGLTKGNKIKPYNVWHPSSRSALVKGLVTQSYWSEFANGVNGATATGGPSNPQFVESWNANPAVNARKLKLETLYIGSNNEGDISDPTKLYLPHTEAISNCYGYWFVSAYVSDSVTAWCVNHSGSIYNYHCNSESLGVRPVVCLPSNLTGTIGETVEI